MFQQRERYETKEDVFAPTCFNKEEKKHMMQTCVVACRSQNFCHFDKHEDSVSKARGKRRERERE